MWWAGILLMAALAATIAVIPAMAAARLKANESPAVEKINHLLPQIQCGQCGYPGCRPYAAAIVAGEANFNQCAPGGEATIVALGRVLERAPVPLNPEFGTFKAAAVAVIDEQLCIGCARCLQACPVDAILGASRYMHTVIRSECTGCELCLAPCPVDCISLIPARD